MSRPDNFPSPLRLLNIRTNDIGTEGLNMLKIVVRDRVVSHRSQFLLFADHFDSDTYTTALIRLARASQAAPSSISGDEGSEDVAASSARSRLQRRISVSNLAF